MTDGISEDGWDRLKARELLEELRGGTDERIDEIVLHFRRVREEERERIKERFAEFIRGRRS